ncbi:uncharacterized protein WM294_013169 [Sarcoramphus papa]
MFLFGRKGPFQAPLTTMQTAANVEGTEAWIRAALCKSSNIVATGTGPEPEAENGMKQTDSPKVKYGLGNSRACTSQKTRMPVEWIRNQTEQWMTADIAIVDAAPGAPHRILSKRTPFGLVSFQSHLS